MHLSKQVEPMEQAENAEKKEWTKERRKMRRLTFTASVDVMDLATRETFNLRMTDIGLGGCFLDTIFPFSVGARVCVTLSLQLIEFKANGRVVYSQPQVGMGIAFDELNADQRLALMALV